MRAVEEHVVIAKDGFIELNDLPVKAGDRVKVIVLIQDGTGERRQRYPLRGTLPYRFDDPTSPVGVDDWEPGK